MQRSLPWLHWSCCYAHRLDLACKYAFSSTPYSLIEEMLLCLYYLYKRLPKKSRELDSIVDSFKDSGPYREGRQGKCPPPPPLPP